MARPAPAAVSSPRLLAGRRRRARLGTVLATALVALGALLCLAPIFWMLSTSFKEQGDALLLPPKWVPIPPRWQNYPEALEFMRARQVYLNSFTVAALSVAGSLASCSLIAYPFARLRAPGRDPLFLLVVSLLMLPGQVTLIPQFVLFRQLGWTDTFLPLVVPLFFGAPYFIFLLRQFFLTIPREMDEAATIDGCGYFGIYWRIILPLSKPALGVVAIQEFIFAWNDFLRPLIFLTTREKLTVAVALRNFTAEYGATPWNLLMAASLVALLPPVIMFFVAQRYFVQGIVISGVKG